MRAWLLQHETKIRFLFVGGFNTLFGLSAYPLLYWTLTPLGLHYMEVLLVSQAICVPVSFLTNKVWVFRTKGNYLREFVKFASFHMSNLLANLLILPLLVNLLGLNPVIAQTLFVIVVVISAYFWYSRVTFRNRNNARP